MSAPGVVFRTIGVGCAARRHQAHCNRENTSVRVREQTAMTKVSAMEGAKYDTGLAFILAIPLLVGGAACATRIQSYEFDMKGASVDAPAAITSCGWSNVKAVTPGAEIEVRLNDAAALPEKRIVKGRFHAVTADALVLTSPDGSERILERQAVHVIRARRPFWTRSPGWIALALGAGSVTALFPPGGDLSWSYLPVMLAYTSLPASLPFFFASAMKTVYTAPTADGELHETDWTTSPRTCGR